MKISLQLIVALFVSVLFLSCKKEPYVPAESQPVPPIYVTIALHIEDVPKYAFCDSFVVYRQKLLQFAEAMAPWNVKFNLQVDYEFLMGIKNCEHPGMQSETMGMNLLEYLISQYNYEIDPHQEGGCDTCGLDNYADIKCLGFQITPNISDVMGGLVHDDDAQWNALAQGQQGNIYPQFEWTPEILTLAVGTQHHFGDFSFDDYASGVWIPKGTGSDFWVHDPSGPFIYIGPGEYDNWSSVPRQRSTLEFIEMLRFLLTNHLIKRDAMYTASIAVPQHMIFNPVQHLRLMDLLDKLLPYVDEGKVVFVHYSEAAEIWKDTYDSKPNIVFLDE